MVNVKNNAKLLALPLFWMGSVQLCFGLLAMFVFHDGVELMFIEPSVAMTFVACLLLLIRSRTQISKVTYRDALVFAALTWIASGVLGALPIYLIANVNFTDAVFESISALTTTGATVLTGLDVMPPSFLLYRQFLQWMGGLGVVIFVVAVLPMLNVGGMKLLKAETPGPIKDEKLSPRIANTAHYLWLVYLSLTGLCILAYQFSGMSLFDAVAHAFTTVSTGGFSTHDASLWYFQSHTILAVSNLFMLAGAISFALHFTVARHRSIKRYWQDEETRVFLIIVAILSLVLSVYLLATHTYNNATEAFSFALFHVISFITSTGFGAADLSSWPAATAVFLVVTAYLGGCAGSTAGGNKIIRNIITFKIFRREFYQLSHPRGCFSILYQGQPVDLSVRHAVMTFMSVAAVSSMFITLAMMATGLDFWSAFTAVAACLNVLGPGFGTVGSNFQPVNDTGIWILSFSMILGRLEYFTLLALLIPAFWRR